MKESKRKAVTTANKIRKVLTEVYKNEEDDTLDMTKMAKNLAERREKVLEDDAE